MALGWFVENIDLTFLQPLIDAGRAMMDGLLGGFKERAQEAIKDFTKSIEDIIAAVKETLGIESPSTVFFEIGKAIIQGMWDGMLALWGEVRAWFNTAIEELPGWLKRLLNISSPSKVMMQLGEYTIQGFLLGMQNAGGGNLGAAASAAIGIGYFNLPAAPLPVGAGIGNLTVQVNNPTVREDEDIDRIAEAVAEKLSEALYDRQKLGGHSSW